MQKIGHIKQVQIQPSALKQGQKPHRIYDPTPLLVVSRLRLSPVGVVGITAEGQQILDIHHLNHPQSRNADVNTISMGFTSHYHSMRTQFGPHLLDGRAGENILVETDNTQTLADLEHGIAIQIASTGQLIYLNDAQVAAPCVEFSHYAANQLMPLSNQQLKETLQFLHDGRRGFYMTMTEPQHAEIQAGDLVFTLSR